MLCTMIAGMPHSLHMRKIPTTKLHSYRFFKRITVWGMRRVGARSRIKLGYSRVNTVSLFSAKTVLEPLSSTRLSVLLNRESGNAPLFWRYCERICRRIGRSGVRFSRRGLQPSTAQAALETSAWRPNYGLSEFFSNLFNLQSTGRT